MNTTNPNDAAKTETPKTKALATIPQSPAAEAWALIQRKASALATSSLVPKEYANNVPNCIIAMQLADRLGADPMMVIQNLDVIHGRPSWRATFLIATVNACGRFSPLRFRFQGKEGSDDWGCRAVAKDKTDGEECVGTLITIAMAKKEGWYQKPGSKWQTMPEQMLLYRAAAFWTRAYASDLSLGMHTSDEIIDTTGYDTTNDPPRLAPPPPQAIMPGNTQSLEDALRGQITTVDPETGEVKAGTPVPDLDLKRAKREPGEEG